MKRILPFFLLLLLQSVAWAQSGISDSKHLPAIVVARNDSIVITPPTPFPATVIDTIDTKDKFVKILLYEDFTWNYIDLGRPVIDEATFYEGWDTDEIHAFKDVPLSELPDEIDLMLVDSLHGFCPPYVAKVFSGYRFRGSREHKGSDLTLHIGDTIRAAFDGVVRVVLPSRQSGGYGQLLVLRHSNGLETYYGHLSKQLVEVGEAVKAGEVIGLGGNTGRSTGPHLHFEVRYMGKPFDPERIIDFEHGTLRDTLFTLHKHYFNIYSHHGQTDEESLAASQRILHTIRSGDTLGALAIKYRTTVSNICKLNGISSKTILRTGRKLIVR